MQRFARENVQRILAEQEKMSYELESKKRKIDSWTKELNKREAQTDREREKLDEEKKKVACFVILTLLIHSVFVWYYFGHTSCTLIFYSPRNHSLIQYGQTITSFPPLFS